MNKQFQEQVNRCRVIAGIKDEQGLQTLETLAADSGPEKGSGGMAFILFGDILSIGGIVERVKAMGMTALVNADLVDGLAGKGVAVDYLRETARADGILSSKVGLIQAARKAGMFTVHRIFLIDSFSFHNLEKQIEASRPDAVEILPGAMPRAIGWVLEKVRLPVVAGGLVCEEVDVEAALAAGAAAVSTTNQSLWS